MTASMHSRYPVDVLSAWCQGILPYRKNGRLWTRRGHESHLSLNFPCQNTLFFSSWDSWMKWISHTHAWSGFGKAMLYALFCPILAFHCQQHSKIALEHIHNTGNSEFCSTSNSARNSAISLKGERKVLKFYTENYVKKLDKFTRSYNHNIRIFIRWWSSP